MATNERSLANQSSLFRSTQMKLFMAAVERTVEEISEGVSIEEFSKIVGKIESLQGKKKRIKMIHSVLKKKLLEHTMAELNEMVIQENLDDKFISLNELIDGNGIPDSDEQITPAWRPPRNVPNHIRSHLMKVKLDQKSNLEQYVQEQEESVKNLMNVVNILREKACETENDISKLNEKVQKMNEDWERMLDFFRDT